MLKTNVLCYFILSKYSVCALYTLFYAAHKRRAWKLFFRIEQIFEVEKSKIFLLQKFAQSS
jgi:hypothetical protein